MRLSTRTRYALRLMIDLAKNGGQTAPVSLAAVAERTALSRSYLEQLAISLKNHRLLRGVCGKQGGYQLTKPAKDVSLREIIEAVSGPLCIIDCVEDPLTCMRAEECECRLVYALINRKILDVLEEFSLADLEAPGWRQEMGTLLSSLDRDAEKRIT
jgi:Rrf2 family protein